MARRDRPTIILGLLAGAAGALVILYALSLGFYIEATTRAIVNSAKGHRIAVPAVVALVTGVAAAFGFRRRWAVPVVVVAVVAAVVAVLMSFLIPSGTD